MRRLALLLTLAIALSACHKQNGTGRLDIILSHTANGNKVVFDSVTYTNEIGNLYIVNEIQYFISNISLQKENGEWLAIDANANTHYIDTDIEASKTLSFSNIEPEKYTHIRFTFGLDETDNITGRFTEQPESNMFWPEPLGGGYHYMKLNGKWINSEGQYAPMNVHLGIGQNNTLTEFYQNYFQVLLPIDVNITEDREAEMQLNMVIDNWFRTPNIIDLAEYGSGIMQNQTAQELFKANGNDVFQILP